MKGENQRVWLCMITVFWDIQEECTFSRKSIFDVACGYGDGVARQIREYPGCFRRQDELRRLRETCS